MKLRHAIALSSIVFATAFSGMASAFFSTGSLATDVQSAVGTGNVVVLLDEGTATLVGNVETRVDANAAETAAINFPGVDSVINHLNVD